MEIDDSYGKNCQDIAIMNRWLYFIAYVVEVSR